MSHTLFNTGYMKISVRIYPWIIVSWNGWDIMFFTIWERNSHIFSEYLVIGSTLVFHWGALVFVSRHEPAGKKQGMWISWSKSDTLAQNIFRTKPNKIQPWTLSPRAWYEHFNPPAWSDGHCPHTVNITCRGVTGTARMLHALTHSSISRQVREQM